LTLLRRPGAVFATLLFLLMGAAFLTQVVPYRQIIDSQRRVDSARAELGALEAENETLQADVDALGTPGEIEKLAREKLGYVRPGETSFIVLDPLESGATPSPEVEPSQVESKTWVDKIWEFISGGDVASDG